jgi:hypothetical protein
MDEASRGGVRPSTTDDLELQNGQTPKPVMSDTPWVRSLRGDLIKGYANWTVANRQNQLSNGQSLPQPEVTAAGITGSANGNAAFSMSQKSRTDYNEPDKDTLAASQVRSRNDLGSEFDKQGKPNEKLSNAHAELIVIQKLYDAGRTNGQILRMIVTGRDVCGDCSTAIPAAAHAAGLKAMIIYESSTGRTKYWVRDQNEELQYAK